MNYIDIIIILLVLLAAFKGFSRGLIKEVLSLISLIAGVYIATNFSVYFEKHLTNNFPKFEDIISVVSFVLVFLIVFLSLKLAAILISKLAKSLQLGLVNKLLGLLFGGVKVLLILSFVLFEINHLDSSFGEIIPKKQKEESFLYQPLSQLIPTINPISKEKSSIKDKIEKKFDETIESIKNNLDTIPE